MLLVERYERGNSSMSDHKDAQFLLKLAEKDLKALKGMKDQEIFAAGPWTAAGIIIPSPSRLVSYRRCRPSGR
jgi:hypothetical protein